MLSTGMLVIGCSVGIALILALVFWWPLILGALAFVLTQILNLFFWITGPLVKLGNATGSFLPGTAGRALGLWITFALITTGACMALLGAERGVEVGMCISVLAIFLRVIKLAADKRF